MVQVSLTDYGSQLAEIQRRQRMAEMLQQQGQEAIPIQSYKGIQAPIPWTAILAKALATGVGAWEGRQVDEQQAKLAASQRDEATQFIRGLGMTSGQPLPLQTISQTPDIQLAQGQPQLPTGPAVAGPAPVGPSPSAQDYAKALGPPAPAPQPMAAPPAQPGYADTAPMTFTPEQQASETQNRLLQASMSGNPYLERVAPTLYAHNQAIADKTDERQFQMSLAEAKAKATLQNKLLYDQMKPEEKTAMQKDYGVARGQGYTGSFMDFMQFAAPKFISTQADQQLFNQRALATGGGPTAPPIAGAQLESLITQSFPGAAITSRARSPEQNAAANGVPDSAHLTDHARDFTLPTQQAMQQAADAINQQGLPGVKAIYEGPGAKNSTGPHVHVEVTQQVANGPVQPVAIGPSHPQRAGGLASLYQLTPEEQAAIDRLAGEKKLDIAKLTRMQAKNVAHAALANPDLNPIQLHAIANVTANPAFQQRAKALEALPASLELVMDAGKKLDFSNIKAIGGVQAWIKDQVNNPDFRNYMAKRNDALQRLAYAMRGVGMSDNAVNLELKAAPEAMSPPAFQAWYNGQLEMVQKQLANQAVFQVAGGPAAPPAAAPMTDAQRLAKYGIH